MSTVLVTIDTPEGALDVSMPTGVDGTRLVSILVDRLGVPVTGAGWVFRTCDGTPIDGGATLEHHGVLDGTRLHLAPVEAGEETRPRHHVVPPRPVAQSERPTRVLPEPTDLTERIRLVVGAWRGSVRPRGARGRIDRARAAWVWTDHRRRLEWLLARPGMARSVVIGVVGHRSDDITTRLASVFSGTRLERVVVVDGDYEGHRLSRRATGAAVRPETVVSGMRRRDLMSVERDRLFARLGNGALIVPTDPHRAAPDAGAHRRLLDSLTGHAGIVVVDCGPSDRADATILLHCDQVVDASFGRTLHHAAQTVAVGWEDAPDAAEAFATHHLDESDTGILELAVILAGGWSALDISGPLPHGL